MQEKVVWSPKPVLTFWGRENFVSPTGICTLDHPTPQPIHSNNYTAIKNGLKFKCGREFKFQTDIP
jgi:hypothetical protein